MSAPCPDCDVDPGEWTVGDQRRTLAELDAFWRYTLSGVDPSPAQPHRQHAAEQLTRIGRDLGVAGTEAQLAVALSQQAPPLLLASALHEAMHGLRLGGRALARAGLLATAATGTVAQVSLSHGGLPKTAVTCARVDRGGLVDDVQRTRQHHGRPFQALCLYSTEVLTALRTEGHRVGAGVTGENLTLTGLDWKQIRPGVRVRVGAEVLVEISAYAVPCVQQKPWFVDGGFRRILQDEHPGWARTYAWVVTPGPVAAGDHVRVLP